jgi:predicted enzyme related to lactoylglutathione lyase
LLKKTFLSKEAGHIAYFMDTEGNKLGLHSMS